MNFDHSLLRATYSPDQRWETMVVEKVDAPQWVPVYGEPLWDERQQYRLASVRVVAAQQVSGPSDDEIRAVWNRVQDPVALVREFLR